MNVERMTQRVQEALDQAYQRALREHHTQTTVEHLLAALLEQQDGIVPAVVQQAGIDPRDLARRVAVRSAQFSLKSNFCAASLPSGSRRNLRTHAGHRS